MAGIWHFIPHGRGCFIHRGEDDMQSKSIIIIFIILISLILIGSIYNPVEAQTPTNTPRPTYTPAPTFVPTNNQIPGCPASSYFSDYSLYDYEYLSRCGHCVPGYNGINLTPVFQEATPEGTPVPTATPQTVHWYKVANGQTATGSRGTCPGCSGRVQVQLLSLPDVNMCGTGDAKVGEKYTFNMVKTVGGGGDGFRYYDFGDAWWSDNWWDGTGNINVTHSYLIGKQFAPGVETGTQFLAKVGLPAVTWTNWRGGWDGGIGNVINGAHGFGISDADAKNGYALTVTKDYDICYGSHEPVPEPPCDYAGYVEDVEQTGGVSTARDAVGEPDENFWYEVWNPFMAGTAKFNINKKDVSRIRFLRGTSEVDFYEGDMSITVYGCEGEVISNYVSHWGDIVENIAGFLYTEKKCVDNITFDIFPNSSENNNNWVHIDAIEVTGCDMEDLNGDCMTPWENYVEPAQTIAYIEWGNNTNFIDGECRMVFQPISIDTTSAFYSGLIALLPPAMQASIPSVFFIPGIELCEKLIQAPSFYILGVEVPVMQYLGILVAFFVIKNLFLRL